jgi:hypothetical protein
MALKLSLEIRPTGPPHLGNSTHPRRIHRERVLLLLGFRAGRSVDLVLAVPVRRSALIRVVINRQLELKQVGTGSGVDIGGVALAFDIAFAFYVVFVREAAGAREFRVGCGEADVEAIVAAGGAAEDELVNEE